MQARDLHLPLTASPPKISSRSIEDIYSETSKLLKLFDDSGATERGEHFSETLEKNFLYLIDNAHDQVKTWALYCLGTYAAGGCVKHYTQEDGLSLITEAANLGKEEAIQFLASTYLGLGNKYFKKIGSSPLNSKQLALKYGVMAFKQGDEDALGNLNFWLIKGSDGLDKDPKLFRQVYYDLFFDLKLESDEQRLCEAISILCGALTDPFFEPLLLPFTYILLRRWQQSDLWNDTSDKNEKLLKTVFTVHAENVDNPRLIILNRLFQVLDEDKLYELLKRPKSYQPPFHELDLFFGEFIPEVETLLSKLDQSHKSFTDYFKQWHANSCFDINQPIDDLKNTLLHLAVRKNNPLFLDYLLMLGADIDIQNNFGQTPLLISCEYQQVDLVKQLLEHDANPEIGDEVGFYPMHFACLHGYTEIFHLLLAAKANCNPISSYTGATPLLLAVKNNRIEIVKLLLQQDANIEVKNKRGLGLLYFAMRQDKDLTRLLLSVGIKIPEDYRKWSAAEEWMDEIVLVLEMREKKSITQALRYYNEDKFPTLKQLVGFTIFKNDNLKKLATEKELGKDLREYIETYLPRNLSFLEENSQLPMVSSSSIP